MNVQTRVLRRSLLFTAGCLLAVALRAQEVPAGAPVPSKTTALSLFGEPLTAIPMSATAQQEREERYRVAKAAAEARPDDVEAQVWWGRRAAWLGRFQEAVDVFSRALVRFPGDPRLLRHRGHRYITLRRFDLAVGDLKEAARRASGGSDVAEEGEGSAKVPTDTLRSNIWYHLGIAHYLAGDFEAALHAERECLRLPYTPVREAGVRFWSYLALRRRGRLEEARRELSPIRPNMAVVENRAYLLLMMMYKGELSPDSLLAPGVAGNDPLDPVILRYGVGAWYLVEGRRAEAVQLDREVLTFGQWHSFAHIAAEADLQRLGETPPSRSPAPGA